MLDDLAGDVIRDLLRSAWLVEKGRAAVLGRWSHADAGFVAGAERANERAGIVGAVLEEHGGVSDGDLVEPHAEWIRSLVGDAAPDLPFADVLLVRLGEWVEGHAGPFLGAGADRLRALGDADRSAVRPPGRFPSPPGFEPLPPPAAAPEGEVRLRFGILADLHIGSAHGEVMARAAIADLNRSGAEVVVQLGDITDRGNLAEFERAAAVLAELEMPYVTMMGNHDVLSIDEQRLSGREYLLAHLGREADGVLEDHAGFRFAVLDSAEMGASPFAPFDLVTGSFVEGPAGAVVRGTLTPPQHEILAEVSLPGSGPAFVFLHHPPQPFTGFPPVVFGLRDRDSQALGSACASGNVWGVFAGHTHRNARTRDFGGVPAHEVATARDFPFGYGLVDVTDAGYAYRFVQLSDEGLLRAGYERTGDMFRRYATGSPPDRGFVWAAPHRAPAAGA